MSNENEEAKLWVKQVILELKSEYREFIYPISMLQIKESKMDKLQEGFATDGTVIYYHPEYILENRKDTLKLQLLHIILHGLLGHFEIKDQFAQKEYRDFMMDMQVEGVLMRMKCKYACSHGYSWRKLEQYVQGDYSMNLYRRFCEEEIPTMLLQYHYQALQADNHAVWDEGNNKKKSKMHLKMWSEMREKLHLDSVRDALAEGDINKLSGIFAGTEREDEKHTFEVGQGRVNYRELLQKLISTRETDKEVPDSIDYMLYQYGLKLYEDVPLVEPGEEAVSCGNMLVIAIDVSGSCISDEQMKLFWGETYECLQRLKEHCSNVEVLLIQCDDVIRKEKKINLKELLESPEEIMVYGGGGTDFTPVFDRLSVLEKTENKIDALLYLTDGVGKYPEEKPDYPVYFILSHEDDIYYDIPEWINTVTLV